MKATDLLAQQHRKVKAIFKKLEHGRGDTTALLSELANDLAAHMAIEHELLYPVAAEVDGFLVEEAYEEHALGEIAIKRLLAVEPEDPSFKAKVTAARELIVHHADEEEEELFPKLEKAIDADQLKTLGKQMKQRFDALMAQGYEAILPKGYARTAADAASQKWMRVRRRTHARAA